MIKYTFSIGANNKTGILEKDKIEDVVGGFLDSFTMFEAIGYWKGQKEKSVVVEVILKEAKPDMVLGLCNQLKNKLEQDAVLVQRQAIISNLI